MLVYVVERQLSEPVLHRRYPHRFLEVYIHV